MVASSDRLDSAVETVVHFRSTDGAHSGVTALDCKIYFPQLCRTPYVR